MLGRARQTSFIVPGLELVIRDLRGDTPVEEKFRHDGGIAEFTEYLSHDQPVTDVLRLRGVDTFTETVPLLDDKGHMTPQEVERELTVDIKSAGVHRCGRPRARWHQPKPSRIRRNRTNPRSAIPAICGTSFPHPGLIETCL